MAGQRPTPAPKGSPFVAREVLGFNTPNRHYP
jgi:hypothetical protein